MPLFSFVPFVVKSFETQKNQKVSKDTKLLFESFKILIYECFLTFLK